MRKLTGFAALVVLLLAAAEASAAENGRILFRRDPPERHAAFVMMRPRTGAIERWTTRGAANYYSLEWSPDGRLLVMSRFNIYRCAEIYVMDARFRQLRRLTSNRACDTSPSWSPDGRWITFASDRKGSNPQVKKRVQHDYNVYVMRSTGAKMRRLTFDPRDESCPDWSPDGRRIAFSVGSGRRADIYAMRTDGTDRRRLTRAPGADACPDWSPDGRWIAFTSRRHDRVGGAAEIYVMRASGRRETRLTRNAVEDTGPAWSPDGRRLLFARETRSPRDTDLYLIRPDGSRARALTANAAIDSRYAWRPRV
jgi:TolB protein